MKKPDMSFIISDQERLGVPHSINPKQETLSILKERGAPIVGIFDLEIDPNYEMVAYNQFKDSTVTYDFYKIKR